MIRRARSIGVLTTIAAGALGVISSTQTWVHVLLADATASDVAVPGATAIPVLAPLSLAVLALGAALSIVGRVLRVVFGVLTIAIAVLLAVLSIPVVTGPPVSAIAPSVTEITGIAGDAAVAGLVGSATLTAWPAATVVIAVVLVLAGLFTVVTGPGWSTGGRKYEAAARRAAAHDGGPLDAIDSWDELSRGDDPTSGGTPR